MHFCMGVSEIDTYTVFDTGFWESAWDSANALDNKRKREKEAVDVWNRRAKNYDRNVGSDSGRKRVDQVLAFLDRYGVLSESLRILDLGSGPGNFALALAGRGHRVVALDPAENMLAQLEEKLAESPELQPFVRTVAADWIPLDLDDYGWDGYFDLVFASMTPGIQDVATLQKAIRASAKYVYLSRLAGPRTHPAVDAIWERLHGGNYYSHSLDILYPLNWLYSAGYRPAVHFSRWEREHRQPAEDAVDEIRDVLAMRMDVDEGMLADIRRYAREKADPDGFLTEKKGATSGMLLWRVDKAILSVTGG